MEELKMLVDMVAHLPQMALWVALGFWAYKVIVIGSIYGVIRFVVDRAHSYLMTPKHELKTVEMRPTIDGMCITGEADRLIAQLRRVAGKRTGIDSQYIHGRSVEWLREAIDEKIARDAQKTEKVKS